MCYPAHQLPLSTQHPHLTSTSSTTPLSSLLILCTPPLIKTLRKRKPPSLSSVKLHGPLTRLFPSQQLRPPPCCCRTNPPGLSSLHCFTVAPIVRAKRESWEGGEVEKRKRRECALSVLWAGRVHPHQGVEIPLQLPAFFSLLLHSLVSVISSWHHVPP